MRSLKALVVLALSCAVMSVAWSAAESKDATLQKQRCIEQINQRTAALVAEDWSVLERLAQQYAKTCKSVFDNDDHSKAYEHIAIANVRMNNGKKALAASDRCINIAFSNSGCHLQKVEALIQLKRHSEAKALLERTEKLVQHRISITERDLRDARAPLEKELLEARLKELAAQQEHAVAVKKRYFSQ